MEFKVNKGINRLKELTVWCIMSAICLGGVFISARFSGYTIAGILAERYLEVILSFILVTFPILFEMVFDVLPITALNEKLKREKGNVSYPQSIEYEVNTTNRVPVESDGGSQANDENVSSVRSRQGANDRLIQYSSESRLISKNILRRAGIYLLVGVMIAATGLLFFYLRGIVGGVPRDVTAAVFVLAPHFGILFFIEILAFFFLRQHRAAMDEFRYYEAVARAREEMFVKFLLLEDNCAVNLVDAIKNGEFSSQTSDLAPGYSTELLEARKLEGSDLAGLAKILEGLAEFKK